MVALVCSMLLAGSVAAEPAPTAAAGSIGSYLYQPCYELDDKLRGPARPYWPQPGDIMLATDGNFFWTFTHWLAGAGQPHNSGIVVARPDGSLGLLEAGPNDTLHVRILDLLPHLTEYSQKGPVWLRRRTIPLTAEQCARLTEFAQAQDGKRFALIRLAGQLTPFRSRGPLRTYFLGKPHGNRCSYFCSELVTEACVAAGLLDAATARPAATYPHELFFDRSPNLYLNQHFRLAPAWDPPARWMPTVPPEDLQAPLSPAP
jgi:hypothetical protein